MTRPDDGLPNFKKMRVEAAKILTRIRLEGGIDLISVFADRHKKDALAELDGSGAIRATGQIAATGFAPFEIAPDLATAERWFNEKIRWPSGKPHRVPHKPFVLFDHGEDHG